MKKTGTYYKLYNKHGLEGYYVQVRNSFNNCLEQEFIPATAKDLYEKTFGGKIISDKEFMEWYTENAERFF